MSTDTELPDPELAKPPPRPVEAVEFSGVPLPRSFYRSFLRVFGTMAVISFLLVLWSGSPLWGLFVRGRVAQGTLTRKEHYTPSWQRVAQFQWSVSFEFATEEGKKVPASTSVTEEVFSSANPGDAVSVRYDPKNPGRNFLIPGQTDEPYRFVWNSLFLFVLSSVMTGTFALAPRRMLRLHRGLCENGRVEVATVTSVRRPWWTSQGIVEVALTDASGKEDRRRFVVPAGSLGDYVPGRRVSLLIDPHKPRVWLPYHLASFRVC